MCNNPIKRQLWKHTIEKYTDIINNHNTALKIKVISNNGEQIFNTQNDVARFFNCSKTTINKYLKNGELYKDFKIILLNL